MAVTTDQLTVKVVVDSKGAIVGFQDISGKIKDLNGQFKTLDANSNVVEKAFSELGENAQKAFLKIQNSAKDATEPINKTSDATQGLQESLDKTKPSLSDVERGLQGFGFEALKLNAAIELSMKAFQALRSVTSETVGLYAEAEKMQLRLSQAIATAGDRVQNSAESWQAYLQSIERATGADADNLAGVVARTLNLGFSEKQTRALIEASLKLAKVQGTEVEESLQTLIGSYRGVARELKVVLPEINKFGGEQERAFLQSGGAIDLINKKYADISVAAMGYSGSVKLQGLAFDDLKEQIGQSLVQFLNLEGKTKLMTELFYRLKSALDGIDFVALREGLISFGAIAAGVVTIILGATGAFAGLAASLTALLPIVLSAVLAFLKFTAIAAAVLAAAAAIDILIRNVDKVSDGIDYLMNRLMQGVRLIQGGLLTSLEALFGVLGLKEEQAKVSAAIATVATNFDKLGTKAEDAGKRVSKNFDFGFAGQAINALTGAFERFNKTPSLNIDKPGQDSQKTDRKVEIDQVALAEKLKAIKDLIYEIDQKTAGLGQNQYAQLQRDYNLQKLKLDNSLLEAKKARASEQELNALREQGVKALDAQLAKGQGLLNQDVLDRNKQLQAEINQLGLTQKQIALDNARLENEKLDKLIAQAQAVGAITTELERQKKLNIRKAQQTPLQAGDAALIGGLSTQITGIFSGPIGAFTSAAEGIVSGVQKLIDLIPNILNGVANIFKTLTELPMRIVESLKNIIGQLANFIATFIPNIFKAIPEIIVTILDAITQKIPDAILQLADSIPIFIEAIVSRIPEIVSKLVVSLVGTIPTLAIKLTTSWIRTFPLVVAQMPKIAIAIVKGIVDGLKSAIFGIGDALAGLFGDSLSAGVSNALPALQTFATGVSDQLFKVGDFAAGQKIQDAADTANSVILDLEKKTLGLAQRIWAALLETIQRSWSYLVSIGVAIWNALVDTAKSTWDFLKSIGTTIWEALKDGFTKGLDFFSEAGTKIWEALKKGLTDAGSGLLAILNNLNPINLINKLFNFSPSQGRVENWLGIDIPVVRFAQGGKVPGYAPVSGDSLKNDRVPALLSAGEIVLPRSIVNNNAYKDVIEAMFRGENVAQFAFGGIKKIGGQIAGVAKGVVSGVVGTLSGLSEDARAVWDFLKSFGANLDLAAFIMNPGREAMAAFQSVASKVFFSSGVKSLFQEYLTGERFAAGGYVNGYGTGDSVPAMLTPGEFVINREAANALGRPALTALNSGQTLAQSAVTNMTVSLTINTTKPIDPAFVRDQLMPTIKDELRKESRRGGYIIAAGGVRA